MSWYCCLYEIDVSFLFRSIFHLVFLFCCFSFFFFFKQKTAYELRISDWSSDVCSSDLHESGTDRADRRAAGDLRSSRNRFVAQFVGSGNIFPVKVRDMDRSRNAALVEARIGDGAVELTASADPDRTSVVEGKRVSVRVGRGGPPTLKKKKKHTSN